MTIKEKSYVIFDGKSFVRLGSHIKESHGLTIVEYKERFGLCHGTRTTEKSYSSIMSRHAKNNGMDQQLLEAGKATRIKKVIRICEKVKKLDCKSGSIRASGKLRNNL